MAAFIHSHFNIYKQTLETWAIFRLTAEVKGHAYGIINRHRCEFPVNNTCIHSTRPFLLPTKGLGTRLSYNQEYIIGRERESILLHILLCKRIADN